MLARAAERRATGQAPLGASPAPEPAPRRSLEQQLELETARDQLQSTTAVHALHELLRDLAAYLGDRPSRDADAMLLYSRVMAMLGEGQG